MQRADTRLGRNIAFLLRHAASAWRGKRGADWVVPRQRDQDGSASGWPICKASQAALYVYTRRLRERSRWANITRDPSCPIRASSPTVTGRQIAPEEHWLAYPARLAATTSQPSAAGSEAESARHYLEAAKAAFGIGYALVEATATGKLAEYSDATHRIDILKELLTRAPLYKAGTNASSAFQAVINDIFTHESVHHTGEASESAAIAASIAAFGKDKPSLLNFHNWLYAFGIELDAGYRAALARLELTLLGEASFKGAIFDVDGVIADSAHDVHFVCWKEMFEAAITPKSPGFEFTLQMYNDEVDGIPGMEGARRILGKFGFTEEEINTWYPVKNMRVRALLDEAEAGTRQIGVYPTTLALVRELKKHGVKLSTASSSTNAFRLLRLPNVNLFNPHRDPKEIKDRNPKEEAKLRAKAARAADANTIAIENEGDGQLPKNKGKPYPEIFLLAAFRLGLRVEECVVFEDAKDGVGAAKAGNFATVGIDRKAAGLLGKADLVVKDLGEVNYEKLRSLVEALLPRG